MGSTGSLHMVLPVVKINPNHAPAGSPEGGQFTSGPEGAGGSGEGVSRSEATVEVGGKKIKVLLSPLDKKRGYQLVLVNTVKFDAAFKQNENFYIGPGGTENAIGQRYSHFEEYLQTHDSMEASNVGVDKKGGVMFGDGRHRYSVLRDKGVSAIPVAMQKDSIRYAQKFDLLVHAPTKGFGFKGASKNQPLVLSAEAALSGPLEIESSEPDPKSWDELVAGEAA